jgi:hypothetical protein
MGLYIFLLIMKRSTQTIQQMCCNWSIALVLMIDLAMVHALGPCDACGGCGVGQYCPPHVTNAVTCPPGTFQFFITLDFFSPFFLREVALPLLVSPTRESLFPALVCPCAGFYCPAAGVNVPVVCPVNSYCPLNASDPTPCGNNTLGFSQRSVSAANSAKDCYTLAGSPYRPSGMRSTHARPGEG